MNPFAQNRTPYEQVRMAFEKDGGIELRSWLQTETDQRALSVIVDAMGYKDPRTHDLRRRWLLDFLSRNVLDTETVVRPLVDLAALDGARDILEALDGTDAPEYLISRLRTLTDQQARERLITTGSMGYEDIEDAVLASMTADMVSKEPRRLRIEFDWSMEDQKPSCQYRVYEVKGPDPRVYDAVLGFLTENSALVGRAEEGTREAIQELLAKATSHVHSKTGIIDAHMVLETILNQTALGAKYAKLKD